MLGSNAFPSQSNLPLHCPVPVQNLHRALLSRRQSASRVPQYFIQVYCLY